MGYNISFSTGTGNNQFGPKVHYSHKWDGICIDGHLTSRAYENDGSKRTVYEVVADGVGFDEGRSKQEGEQTHTYNEKVPPTQSCGFSVAQAPKFEPISADDELPF